jgi:hypothetical protein
MLFLMLLLRLLSMIMTMIIKIIIIIIVSDAVQEEEFVHDKRRCGCHVGLISASIPNQNGTQRGGLYGLLGSICIVRLDSIPWIKLTRRW